MSNIRELSLLSGKEKFQGFFGNGIFGLALLCLSAACWLSYQSLVLVNTLISGLFRLTVRLGEAERSQGVHKIGV